MAKEISAGRICLMPFRWLPIFAFAPVPDHQAAGYIGGGNFYGVVPYEGRYDALYPTIFSFDKKSQVNVTAILPELNGEFRDAKWLNVAGGNKILVLARNNGSLIFLKPGT